MNLPTTSGETFNLVAVGAWNAAIFSPEWAKNNLSESQEREVVLAIPMQTGLPSRLTVDDVNIFPSSQSLAMECVSYGDSAVEDCVRKFQKIAELLPHTPISAVGINYRFIADLNESEVLSELFTFEDAAKIDAGVYGLSVAQLKRTFSLNDSSVLNLSIDSLPNQLRIEFNFHTDVKALADAAAVVTIDRVRDFRQQALKFMLDVYGIQLDD